MLLINCSDEFTPGPCEGTNSVKTHFSENWQLNNDCTGYTKTCGLSFDWYIEGEEIHLLNHEFKNERVDCFSPTDATCKFNNNEFQCYKGN